MYNSGNIYSLSRMGSMSSVKTHDHKTQGVINQPDDLQKGRTTVTNEIRRRACESKDESPDDHEGAIKETVTNHPVLYSIGDCNGSTSTKCKPTTSEDVTLKRPRRNALSEETMPLRGGQRAHRFRQKLDELNTHEGNQPADKHRLYIENYRSAMKVVLRHYIYNGFRHWFHSTLDNNTADRNNQLNTWRSIIELTNDVFIGNDKDEIREFFENSTDWEKTQWVILFELLGKVRDDRTVTHMMGDEWYGRLDALRLAKQIMGEDRVLGVTEWWMMYGILCKFPSLPKNIDAILTSDCGINTGQKIMNTHRLILIPKEYMVNETVMALTLNRYCRMIGDVKTGYTDDSKIYGYDDIFDGDYNVAQESWYGTSEDIEKWALMYTGNDRQDNGVLRGSRRKTWGEQVAHVDVLNEQITVLVDNGTMAVSDREKPGEWYTIARSFKLVIFGMGFYNMLGTKSLSYDDDEKADGWARTDDVWQTWCSGTYVVVGSFDPMGLTIGSDYSPDNRHIDYGVGVFRVV